MLRALYNSRLLLDDHLATGRTVLVDGGKIAAILPDSLVPSDVERIDMRGRMMLPGFVDLQVNGGGGVLFNDAPTVGTLSAMAAAHQRFGTTAFLPTLISDDFDKIRQALAAVAEALAAGVPGVIGVHLEGPFINPAKRGIHDASKFRRLDKDALIAITRPFGGKVLVTLAPEIADPAHISALVESGVVVCAGHSDASYGQMMESFNHGVSGVTHLYNAMTPLTSREPGVVGAALDDPRCWCCVIADGHHVHPAALRLAIKAKGGTDRFVLVSDAMPTVGSDNKTFVLNGEEIRADDGVCRNAEGRLAGSDLDMASAFDNAISMLCCTVGQASRMASLNPAQVLGLDGEFGLIQPGMRANFVLKDEAGVAETWVDGRQVWSKAA